MSVSQWITLIDEPGFEIWSSYPHPIRSKSTSWIITEHISKWSHMVEVKLNGKLYHKHTLIARQFIPNPNNHSLVRHINKNLLDNRIENLTWYGFTERAQTPAPVFVIPSERTQKPTVILPTQKPPPLLEPSTLEPTSFDIYEDMNPLAPPLDLFDPFSGLDPFNDWQL